MRLITAIAGLVQIGFGLFKVARVSLAISPAVVFLIHRMSHMKIGRVEPAVEGGPITLTIDGSLSFISVPKLTSALQALPEGVPVRLDMHTDLMDHAAFEALHSWVPARRDAGGEVEVVEHVDDWYSLALSDSPKRAKTSLSDPGSRHGVTDGKGGATLVAIRD